MAKNNNNKKKTKTKNNNYMFSSYISITSPN